MARHSVRGGGGYLVEIPLGGNHRLLADYCRVVSRDVIEC